MQHPFTQKKIILRPISLLCLLCALPFFLFLFALSGCKQTVDYFSYVSEFRNNIFLAETDGLYLRIHSVLKETPYAADGVAHESSARTEVFLSAPEGTQNYTFTMEVDGKQYGGELAYDNVKAEYFFSCTLDVSQATSLPCRIVYGEKELHFTAQSVRTANMISIDTLLRVLETEESELFTSMTDKYGFAGEIYIRLICEDAPYYYVGVIDRNGVVNAFLINALSGKILAKRTM